MAFTFVLLPEAQEEYESTVRWYLERSFIAAENFTKSVNKTLETICENPKSWRNA